MLEQIALANVIGKILNLPASVTTGPNAAMERGLNVLANPHALPLWRLAEMISPDGTLRDVVKKVMADLGSTNPSGSPSESSLPYKKLLLSLLPHEFRDVVDFGVTEYIRDPKALSQYVESNLDVKQLVGEASTRLLAVNKPYRCQVCDMPFLSNKQSADISCPFCEKT